MIRESVLDLTAAKTRDIVDAGDYFIRRIGAGETIRIIDLEGNQAADTLFFNAADPSERYSASDTVREQGALYLTAVSKSVSCTPVETAGCSRSSSMKNSDWPRKTLATILTFL